MKKIQYILCLLALAGCDKFLDKMPDNRAEIDTQQKIQALLVSAYPPTDYMLVTEFMSDNVDDYGNNNPYTDRFIDQVFAWDDVTVDAGVPFRVLADDCGCSEKALFGRVAVTPEDAAADRVRRADLLRPHFEPLLPQIGR